MTLTPDEIEATTTALQYYLTGVYVDITDFETIINNRTEPTPGIYQYDCPGQTLWLNSENYAVTYGRQKVTDGKVYYKWTNDTTIEEDLAYEYHCPLEWKKTSETMPWLYCMNHPDDEGEE